MREKLTALLLLPLLLTGRFFLFLFGHMMSNSAACCGPSDTVMFNMPCHAAHGRAL